MDLTSAARHTGTIKTYNGRLVCYYAWAADLALDPLEMSAQDIAAFSLLLSPEGKQVNTIRNNGSAIAVVHRSFVNCMVNDR